MDRETNHGSICLTVSNGTDSSSTRGSIDLKAPGSPSFFTSSSDVFLSLRFPVWDVLFSFCWTRNLEIENTAHFFTRVDIRTCMCS